VIEQLLNVLWLALGAAAFAVVALKVPERRGRAALIVACVLALLFPIISISDDLSASRDLFEQAATLVLAAVILFALIAIARIRPLPFAVPAFSIAPRTDPRSPPCR
jgi:hypothetical protein